jgi:probable phosphoglycerate mutase
MITILLVRHAQNNWVKKNRLAGWIPGVNLNDVGREQAAALGERLAHLPLKAIYSSPLERCMESAEFIANHHPDLTISQLETIGEVRYGAWEGKKIAKLAKKPEWHTVQHFPSRFTFPGGESMRGVQARAVDALEKLALEQKDGMIVVVSHADVIKLVLAHYLGTHIDLFQRIGLSPASVSVVHLSDKGWVRIGRINDDGPIQAPPPPKTPANEPSDKDK